MTPPPGSPALTLALKACVSFPFSTQPSGCPGPVPFMLILRLNLFCYAHACVLVVSSSSQVVLW